MQAGHPAVGEAAIGGTAWSFLLSNTSLGVLIDHQAPRWTSGQPGRLTRMQSRQLTKGQACRHKPHSRTGAQLRAAMRVNPIRTGACAAANFGARFDTRLACDQKTLVARQRVCVSRGLRVSGNARDRPGLPMARTWEKRVCDAKTGVHPGLERKTGPSVKSKNRARSISCATL